MKKLKLTKVIASSLIVASVLILNPIGASAAWKQDSNGWWNTEGSSYSTGWRTIDGKWYYFNSNGYMAHDTIIDGYKLGSDGAWVVTTPTASTTTTGSTTVNNTTGIYYWGQDIKYMNLQGSCAEYYYDYSCYGPDSNKTIEDNLGNTYSNFLTLAVVGFSDKWNYSYIEFPLNGEFKQFKSKLGLTKKHQSNLKDGNVKIYVDDIEVYDTEIKSGDMIKDINIDLTGKNKIKFYFKENGEHTNDFTDNRQEIGFFDGQFIK